MRPLVSALSLAPEVEQWDQPSKNNRPLLQVGVAVVEDLREERVDPDERPHVRLEEHTLGGQRQGLVGLCSSAVGGEARNLSAATTVHVGCGFCGGSGSVCQM